VRSYPEIRQFTQEDALHMIGSAVETLNGVVMTFNDFDTSTVTLEDLTVNDLSLGIFSF
jgi:hypothetical protein